MATASCEDGVPQPAPHRLPPAYGVPVLPGLARPPVQSHATRARENEETTESSHPHKPPSSYGVRVFPPQPGVTPTQLPSPTPPQPHPRTEGEEKGKEREEEGSEENAEKKEGEDGKEEANERLHAVTEQPTSQEAAGGATPVKLSGEPVTLVCPSCQQTVTTETKHETGRLTYIAAGAIFFLGDAASYLGLVGNCKGILGCCLIPFYINKCKDVAHSCPNCGAETGKFKQLGN